MELFLELPTDIQNHIITKIKYSQSKELLNEIITFPKYKFSLYLQYCFIEDYINILHYFYKLNSNILAKYIFRCNKISFKSMILKVYDIWIARSMFIFDLEDIYFEIINKCLDLYDISKYHDYIWGILQQYLHFEPNIYDELDCQVYRKWYKSIK